MTSTLYEKIRKKSIVLLDQDPWIRGSLSLLFQCEACRFAEFDNVAEGMQALRNEQFDVIICDYGMGDEGGIAFLREAGHVQPGAVRILTAGYPLGDIAEAAASEGIDGCLQKPYTLDVLEKTLGGIIDDESAGVPDPRRATA